MDKGTLKKWRARLEKRRSEHRENEAAWRREYQSLCVLADCSLDAASDFELGRHIFEVADLGARKDLISHWRKNHQLERQGALLEVEWRTHAVYAAKAQADDWFIWPAASTALLCFASLALQRIDIAPVVGAIAAAASGILAGLGYRDACMRSMREAVKDARHQLTEAEGWLAQLKPEPLFSRREEETGHPDSRP